METEMPMGDTSISNDNIESQAMPSTDNQMANNNIESNIEDLNMPQNNADDSTIGIINQLSDEDKKAVRAYAESMLSKAENNNVEKMPEANIAESVTFSKAQMDILRETFRKNADKEEKETLGKKETNNTSLKSPFNSPKFN